MKKIILLLSLVFSVVVNAQSNTTRFYTAYDRETITIDNTSGGKGFTATKLVPSDKTYRAEMVTFTVECASGSSCPMRFNINGTAPTTTVGTLIDNGNTITLYNYDNINAFKAIRTGAVSASIQPVYWY